MEPIPDPPLTDPPAPTVSESTPAEGSVALPSLPPSFTVPPPFVVPPPYSVPPPFAVPPPGAAAATLPGQLTVGWSTVFWIAWAGVAGGLAAVWYSSRTVGLSTWWLGPQTEPRLIVVSLLPFVAPLALAIMALAQRRWLPLFGIAGAVLTALVGVGDLGRVNGYAAVELLLAGGGLAVSLGAFAGMLRRPTA